MTQEGFILIIKKSDLIFKLAGKESSKEKNTFFGNIVVNSLSRSSWVNKTRIVCFSPLKKEHDQSKAITNTHQPPGPQL